MKVKDLMTKKVITLSPDDKVDRLFFLFNFENIRHVPVVSKKGELVGIVSDRDLKKVLGAPRKELERPDGTTLMLSTRKVVTVMRRQPHYIEPGAKAADAAAVMAKKRIGALPVVNKNKLVGIITSTDILKAFVKMSSMLEQFTPSASAPAKKKK
ncbi:MAG: CBS domain-containing protein [Gammaproteobacteria bacterium]|nr:CBS domain-containing protein [Gammaproteobacteria bacterium]